MVSRRWVRFLLFVVDGRELHVDLIYFDLEDFDMILGIDWIAKNGATIDSKNKLVTFEPLGEESFFVMFKTEVPHTFCFSVAC